jgi:hypothetical protein
MLDALERISRRRVLAENASRAHNYVCPECTAPVILRAGHERTAYFAHANGWSNEDCARFVAAQGSQHAQETSAAAEGYSDSLQLQIRLKKNGPTYAWGLELVVPTHRVSEGTIVIDLGGRTTEIDLAGNSLSNRTVTVLPTSVPFKVLDVRPSYSRLASVDRFCAALEECGATVFGPMSRPGAGAVGRPLLIQPERTYAFIWQASQLPAYPDELIVELTALRSEWAGALVTIPHQISHQTRIWIEEFTKLKVAPTGPAIVPVWPPLICSVTSQLIESTPNRPLVLYLEHPSSDLSPPIFARSASEQRVARASPQHAPFFELTSTDAKSVELLCANTRGERLDIDFVLNVSALTNFRPEAVRLLGADKNGKDVECLLHSKDASPWLSSVRGGAIRFDGVSLPYGARGVVMLRRDMEWLPSIELGGNVQRITRNSPTAINTRLVARIEAMLRDPVLSVMIDFYAFGRAFILGNVAATDVVLGDTGPLLHRIKVYFKQFPKAAPAGFCLQNTCDTDLVTAFLKSNPTSQSLAHYRQIRCGIPRHQVTVRA